MIGLSARESRPLRRVALYGAAVMTAFAYVCLTVVACASPLALAWFLITHWK
jgi:hypothetical protein